MPDPNQSGNIQDGGNQQNQNASPSAPGQDGNPPEWIPQELKGEKTLHKFKDVANLAKSFLENEKEAGKIRSGKALLLPTEKSSPEEWNNYYKAIGRPDKPEEYELNNDGVSVDENLLKTMLPVFHELGFNKKQAQTLNNKWNEIQKGALEAHERAIESQREKTTGEFKKEWGNDFDVNLKKADAAGVRVFGAEFMAALKASGLHVNPAVIKGLFKLSEVIGEHSFVDSGKQQQNKSTITWEKLLSMKQDPRYWDSGRRDPAYIKEVEAANAEYARGQGA